MSSSAILPLSWLALAAAAVRWGQPGGACQLVRIWPDLLSWQQQHHEWFTAVPEHAAIVWLPQDPSSASPLQTQTEKQGVAHKHRSGFYQSFKSGDECVWRESVRVKGDSSSPDFNHKRRSGESFMFAGLWIKNRLSHFFPLLQNTVHKCNKKNGRKACGSFIDLIISLLIFLLWEQLFHKHAWAEQWVQITALQKHLLEISKNRWKWKDFPISYFKKQKCGH